MKQLSVIFWQQDPKWTLEQLGEGTVDIGQDGCYLTSYADCAVYFGKNTDPSRLNTIFEQKKLYVNPDGTPGGDLLGDDILTKVYPEILYQQTYHYESIPADLNQLKALVADPTLFIIICIDRGNGNVHFSPVIDCDGTIVTIANPYSGKVENFTQDYGDPIKNILRFIVYKGVPATISSNGNYYKGIDLTNQDSIKAAIDAWADVAGGKYIPVDQINNLASKLGEPAGATVDKIITDILQLQQDKKTAQDNLIILNTQTIPQMTTDLKKAQGNIEILTEQLKTANTAAVDTNSGQSWEVLYKQAEIDLKDIRTKYSENQMSWNRKEGQYKNTSYLNADFKTLFIAILKKLFRIT